MRNFFLKHIYDVNPICGRIQKLFVSDKIKNEGSRVVQYFASLGACLSMVVCGSYLAWPSPAIPHLTSTDSTFPVTHAQGSWIVSFFMLGDLLGSLINPLFIDHIGRKYSLFIFAIPVVIGWIITIFANNYLSLCIARFVGGIGVGGILVSLVIYLTEISEKNIRGILVNMMQISMATGVFVFTSIAAYTSYNVLNYSSALLSIISLLIFPLLPETPYYYLMQGRTADAIKSLMKLRRINDPNKFTLEIAEMRLAIEEDEKLKTSSLWELISKSYNRKGLLIILLLKSTQLLSGKVVILVYAQEIFTKSKLSISPGVQVMMIHGVSLLAALITNMVIDRFNRRTLFLATGLLAALCLGSVGLFFFIELYLKAEVSSIGLLPLVALILYHIVYRFGLGSIPYIVLGEIFPINVRGSAVACGMITGSVFSFGTSASYNGVTNATGVYTTFFFFATATTIGSFLTFWIMPETRGRSLVEIQAMQNPKIKKKLDSERRIKKSLNAEI